VFFGIGLHVLVAIYFAVHCVRTGRQLFWLFILFSFPLLGSLVYFIVEYLPDLRVGSKVNQVGTVAAKVLDPNRELREAEIALELTPTAQNRLRLANAYQAAGRHQEAAAQYELCLQGPFANDPDIGLATARARLQIGDSAGALVLLKEIRTRQPAFRGETMAIEIARALQAQGDRLAAGEELRIAEEPRPRVMAPLHAECSRSWKNPGRTGIRTRAPCIVPCSNGLKLRSVQGP
jgi:hypothetical protein